MKNADTFVTEKDIQFEKTLGIPILIVLYLGVLIFGFGLLQGMKWVKHNEKRKHLLQLILKLCIYTMLVLYIIAGMVFIALTATNIFHKVNKWNQTEVAATVLGGDYNENRSHRGASYTTYELFLEYQDKEGKNHITKKAVSGITYNKYDIEESLPLLYRNNNVYDTFILTKSTNEIWPIFFNLYTFFLGFYVVSLFAIIRVWRKKKRKETHDETTFHKAEGFQSE